MPQIRYVTNDVPAWGMGAFTPVVPPTPLASTGGEQIRELAQWSPSPDPALESFNPGPDQTADGQGSYAQTDPRSTTYVRGLPLAFRPVVNATHAMRYRQRIAGLMGPNSRNTHMKIFSDNPLPVPAQNPSRVALPAMRTQPVGTPIATAWPRPFISWPTWGKSRQA